MHELEGEMSRLRVLGIAHAVAAASADKRARRAEEALVSVDEELLRLRTELASTRSELATTRSELATMRTELVAVREDLLWSFAEAPAAGHHAPGLPALVDLRDGAARAG